MPLNGTLSRPAEGAIGCVRRGMKVFPVKANQKIPFAEGWQAWARESTEDMVRRHAQKYPKDNWGVCAEASGLCIVDVDVKEGKKGTASFRKLIEKFGQLPPTLTSRTPSGGLHYFFKGKTKSGNSPLQGYPDIDIKSVGGYVLAPGSIIDGRAYEIIHEAEIAEVPHWLCELNESRKQPFKIPDEGIPAGMRNSALASLAGAMRRIGACEDAIREALIVANDVQCDPPLPQDEVVNIAKSISKYPSGEAKNASVFEVATAIVSMKASEIRPALIPQRPWIMKDRFIAGYISLIIAPGGVGKTTLAILDAASIATGMPLSGFDIAEKGNVWFYNLEDPSDELQRRIAALSQQFSIPLENLEGIHFSSGRDRRMVFVKDDPKEGLCINEEEIATCIRYIKENRIKVMLIDPMIRIHEVPENDNPKMTKVFESLERIIKETGIAVGVLHHFSKSAYKTEPGEATAARGAVSIIDACRVAHTLSVMSGSDADKFAVPEQKKSWFLRLDNAKANLQPPAESAKWYERKSVCLPNGDSVGTLVLADHLKDVKMETKERRLEEEKKCLLKTLSGCMRLGEVRPLIDVASYALSNKNAMPIFKTSDKLETWKEKIKELLLGEGLATGALRFRLEDRGGKPRYIVLCEANGNVSKLEDALR